MRFCRGSRSPGLLLPFFSAEGLYFLGRGLTLFVCGSHFGYHLNYMAARRDTIARTVNIYTRVMCAGTPLLLAWNVGPRYKVEDAVCRKCMQK